MVMSSLTHVINTSMSSTFIIVKCITFLKIYQMFLFVDTLIYGITDRHLLEIFSGCVCIVTP